MLRLIQNAIASNRLEVRPLQERLRRLEVILLPLILTECTYLTTVSNWTSEVTGLIDQQT